MTKIESQKVPINNSSEKIFNFLSDFNNFSKLMPEQVINWKSDENECSFTIKGMVDIKMQIAEKTPYSKIVYKSAKGFSLDFNLICEIEKVEETKCNAKLYFESELSPFLKMMVETPLQNFVDILIKKLKEVGEKS
ncbi:MAG: hypothetical protein PHD97_03405 [Bacteroidales bacterium]|nr:hypothetical protein [Bacteroidales bacterium]